MSNEAKWYESRAGWLEFFRANFTKVRHLVAFYRGAPAGHALDRLKDIVESDRIERYKELVGHLQIALNKAPPELTHCMSGWEELHDLCSESAILFAEERKPESVGVE